MLVLGSNILKMKKEKSGHFSIKISDLKARGIGMKLNRLNVSKLKNMPTNVNRKILEEHQNKSSGDLKELYLNEELSDPEINVDKNVTFTEENEK